MYRTPILSILVVLCAFLIPAAGYSATNLVLNPKLNYSSDSNDGPLITGKNLSEGGVPSGVTSHIIFYHRECYNSKRQARRTVELFEKYKGKVNFIVVDLDTRISKEQRELKDRFYKNYIPHVVVIDPKKDVVYDKSGEVSTDTLSGILDKALK